METEEKKLSTKMLDHAEELNRRFLAEENRSDACKLSDQFISAIRAASDLQNEGN